MQQMKNLFQNCLGKTKNKLVEIFSFKIIYFYIALIVALFSSLFFEIAVYFVVALTAVVAILFPFEQSLIFSISTFTFSAVLDVNGINMNIAILVITMLPTLFKHLIQLFSKKQKLNWWLVGSCLLVLVFVIIPIDRTYSNTNNIWLDLYEIAFFVMFLMIIYTMFLNKNKFNTNSFIKIFSLFLILSCLAAFLRPVSPRLQSLIKAYPLGNIQKITGLVGNNPNMLAAFCNVVLVCYFYQVLTEKIGLESLVFILPIFVFGLYTVSRQFIFAVIILMTLFLIAALVKKDKRILKKALILISSILIVSLIFFDLTKMNIERLGIADLLFGYNNSTDLNVEQIQQIKDPGRGGLFKSYMGDFVSSPVYILIGRGITTEYINNFTAHNTFVHLLWEMGLIGTVLFIFVLFCFVKEFNKANIKQTFKIIFGSFDKYVMYVPLCAVLFVENMFIKLPIIVFATLFILTLCATKKDNKIKVEEDKVQKVVDEEMAHELELNTAQTEESSNIALKTNHE